jgi:16S rRNA (cytosine967-C5)-methyltransferase
MTDARDVAARVLVRVATDGAFASAALEADLARAVQLAARDRALATELVYGSLRVEPWLMKELERFAPRGLDSLDARVRAHLTLAAYQLFFTRVPAFAAVSEAVAAIKKERGPRMAGFANAVLRKLTKRAAGLDGVERDDAVIASTPAWLRSALERALTPEGALAFLKSGLEAPAVALRMELASERDAWRETLRQAAPAGTFENGRTSPRAILARGAGKPQSLPGWGEGAWTAQEEGSQLAALAVGARSGESVLDACAGRGNKTGVLVRAVAPSGSVDACDSNPSKLERLGEELGRLGLKARATFAVDWTVGSGEVRAEYDRVLVDAPCSGVGTLRRRPEIALRREPTDLSAMARQQLAIAVHAADHVRTGGALVYVVCSVLREESEDVLAALLQARSDLTLAPFDAPEARAVCGDATSFRLLPHVHGTDGYFVAMMRRR